MNCWAWSVSIHSAPDLSRRSSRHPWRNVFSLAGILTSLLGPQHVMGRQGCYFHWSPRPSPEHRCPQEFTPPPPPPPPLRPVTSSGRVRGVAAYQYKCSIQSLYREELRARACIPILVSECQCQACLCTSGRAACGVINKADSAGPCLLTGPMHVGQCTADCTLRASLSCTFLQTLPYLVTPLRGHSLSPRSCPSTRSAPSERFGYW